MMVVTYVWDEENRLQQRQSYTGSIEQFTYSPDGLRWTSPNRYHVWSDGQLLQDLAASSVTVNNFVVDPTAIDGYLAQHDPAGDTRILLTDAQQNVRENVQPDATVTSTFLYKAFGEFTVKTGSGERKLRYGGGVGNYYDTTNTQYVQQRYLRNDLARWMSEDPIGFDGGDWNTYRYVANSPVKANDHNGLFFPNPLKYIPNPMD